MKIKKRKKMKKSPLNNKFLLNYDDINNKIYTMQKLYVIPIVWYNVYCLTIKNYWDFLNWNDSSKNKPMNEKYTRPGVKAYTKKWLLMWYMRPKIKIICISISLLMWYRRPNIENICILKWHHAHPELVNRRCNTRKCTLNLTHK